VRLTFRAKLLGLAGVTAAALAITFVSTHVLAARVETELTFIQQRYVPRLGLDSELDRGVERLERAFQDAVAAHDRDALDGARDERDEVRRKLLDAKAALDPLEVEAATQSLDDYWKRARDVSRRLIDGETGEAIVDAIAAMQTAQRELKERLQRVAAPPGDELAAAFARVLRAQETAREYQAVVSVVCLTLALAMSWALGRSLVRSQAAVARGFARFGRGDFAEPISAPSGDELGDLARDANAMAESLARLYAERRRAEAALVIANKELEAFSYSVAHDLRAPLRAINGFSTTLREDYGASLEPGATQCLSRICSAAEKMAQLIDALLSLARVTRAELRRQPVDLSRMATTIAKQLRTDPDGHAVEFDCAEGIEAQGDGPLIRAVLENLIGNAWKFTSKTESARVEFGAEEIAGEQVFFVRDNGAGFDMSYAEKLFAPFQRLHSDRQFAGTGIGLATVQRIVQRHGGRIWAEGTVGRGATFHFTLEAKETIGAKA
jgi:signal transduction histidine kinase